MRRSKNKQSSEKEKNKSSQEKKSAQIQLESKNSRSNEKSERANLESKDQPLKTSRRMQRQAQSSEQSKAHRKKEVSQSRETEQQLRTQSRVQGSRFYDKDSIKHSQSNSNPRQVMDLKIELRRLIKNYSKLGSEEELTASEFKELAADLYSSLGHGQQLNSTQLDTILLGFDSSRDGIIQIEELESVVRNQGLSQKKKKNSQPKRVGAAEMKSEESSLFSMF